MTARDRQPPRHLQYANLKERDVVDLEGKENIPRKETNI
jgi:hypothetical protein